METLQTDQEQVEQLVGWVKQYGPSILLGIFLAIAGNFAWRYWMGHQNRLLEIASMTYEQIQNSAQNNDFAAVRLRADPIFQDYAKTPYAGMAALTLAQQAVAHKDLAYAEERLEWVIVHSKLPWQRQIARLHRAKILTDQNKLDEAMAGLSVVDDKTFLPLVEAQRGQIALEKNDPAAALKHFQAAEKKLPKDSMLATFVKMQIADLTAA